MTGIRHYIRPAGELPCEDLRKAAVIPRPLPSLLARTDYDII